MANDYESVVSRKSFDREAKRKKAQTAPTGVRYGILLADGSHLREGNSLVTKLAEAQVKPVKGRKTKKSRKKIEAGKNNPPRFFFA